MNLWSGLRFLLSTACFAISVGGTVGIAAAAERDTVIVGTGTAAGIYYPVAGAICQVVNGAGAEDDPVCVVVPGEGSKENLEALRAQRTDFAIVQSDWQFWAHTGANFFADPTPFSNLNSVLALHAEPLVIAVRRGSGIDTLDNLKGKSVAVGAPATAARGMMEDLLGALGWSMSDFAEAHELTASQQTVALCAGAIDAAAYAVGSPSATLASLAAQCDVSFLPLTGSVTDRLLDENPFYRVAEIPGGIYAGIDAAVPTFGVGATLVTRADVPDATVEAMVAAVLADLETLRRLHPALTWLDAEQMVGGGLSAPLHPAVARRFSDRDGS